MPVMLMRTATREDIPAMMKIIASAR
ncbi:MAG: acetyltransferase, partial [Lacticaseibacillus paracasei]